MAEWPAQHAWVQGRLLALGHQVHVEACRRAEEGHGGGGGWHKASVSDCLPLAAPIGLSLLLTLCGSERVMVVSTEPLDDLSCLTTAGVCRLQH